MAEQNYGNFTQWALYDAPQAYYRSNRSRVGRSSESDFYTAASLGPLFGFLVVSAVLQRLGPGAAASCMWVEWGMEPYQPTLVGGWQSQMAEISGQAPECPFAGVLRLELGDLVRVPQRAVVFSNELFDAQPFHRFRFLEGAWRELGVKPTATGWEPCVLAQLSESGAAFQERLPKCMPEGYTLDYSFAALQLLESLVQQEWEGLFLAFDYGKPWAALLEETFAGTARAYYRHQLSARLWENPGQQDLTCHVCWDDLVAVLEKAQFNGVEVQTQEAFWVRHAQEALELSLVTAQLKLRGRNERKPAETAQERQGLEAWGALQALLHPAHLGRKFQVLSGERGLSPSVNRD